MPGLKTTAVMDAFKSEKLAVVSRLSALNQENTKETARLIVDVLLSDKSPFVKDFVKALGEFRTDRNGEDQLGSMGFSLLHNLGLLRSYDMGSTALTEVGEIVRRILMEKHLRKEF